MANRSVRIDLRRQSLDVLESGAAIRSFPVSTSAWGPGERANSLCTPRGRHVIRAKIGAGEPENAVFVRRRPTGEIYAAELARRGTPVWVLTRKGGPLPAALGEGQEEFVINDVTVMN